MYCSHQSFNNTKILQHNLGDWSQAVGGTGGIGKDVVLCGKLIVIDTENDSFDIALGRSRDDHLLGTRLDVTCCFFSVHKKTGGFNDDVHAKVSPKGERRGLRVQRGT